MADWFDNPDLYKAPKKASGDEWLNDPSLYKAPQGPRADFSGVTSRTLGDTPAMGSADSINPQLFNAFQETLASPELGATPVPAGLAPGTNIPMRVEDRRVGQIYTDRAGKPRRWMGDSWAVGDAARETTLGEFAGGLGVDLLQGLQRVPVGLADSIGWLLGGGESLITPEGRAEVQQSTDYLETLKPAAYRGEQAIPVVQRGAKGEIDGVGLPSAESLLGTITSSAPQIPTFLAAGGGLREAATRVLPNAPRLAAALGFGGSNAALVAPTGAEEIRMRALAEGATPEQADSAADKAAALLVPLTTLTGGAGGALSASQGQQASSLLRALAGGFLADAPFEGVEEAGQSVIGDVALGKDVDWAAAAEGGVQGTIAGGLPGAAIAALESRRAPRPAPVATDIPEVTTEQAADILGLRPTPAAPAAPAAPTPVPPVRSEPRARIPAPDFLEVPLLPTREQMQQSSRVEEVPLDRVRSLQKDMDFDRFDRKEGPGDLIEGYGDRPVAVRMRNGEYLIRDGNHRTATALADGAKSMPMHVIDAADYDPEQAGRAPSRPASIEEDDALLAELGLSTEVPDVPIEPEATASPEAIVPQPGEPAAPGEAETAPEVERRADVVEGQRLADLRAQRRERALTPEESAEMLDLAERDRLTARVAGRRMQGVQNMEARTEAESSGRLKPVQAFADADNFKAVNDRLGHETGDSVIRQMGELFAEQLGEGNVFHRGGDEFVMQADTPEQLDAAMNAVRQQLADSTLRVTLEDGTTVEQKGVGFSYGAGPTIQEAENAQYRDKEARKAAGLRTDRTPQPGAGAGAPGAAGQEAGEGRADRAEAPEVAQPPPVPPPALPTEPAREPSPKSTGTKNAVMDAERTREGRDPIIRDARKSNESTVDEALQTVEANPRAGDEVVERLLSEGVAGISLADEAVLMVHKVRLRNERDKAAAVLEDPKASESAKAVAQREWDGLEAKIGAIDEASYASGREWGRMGQFRQRMLREDFTLESMERRLRAVTGGKLSDEQVAEVKALHEKLAAAQEKLDAANARLTEAQAATTYDDLIKAMQMAVRGEKKRRPTLERLREAANESRAALAGIESVPSRKGQSGAAINPAAFYHLARIGAYEIANGAVTLADWTARMRTALADRFEEFREMLPEVFRASKVLTAESLGTGQSVDQVMADVGDAPTTQDVRKLAEAHIRGGLRGEGPVMAAVTASLQKKFPDLTERQVRVLFSEYGKATFPSKDEVKVELRRLRSLVQLQESITRLEAGQKALKSGPQRDKDTQEIREKRARLNELLKTLAPTAKTPEQLASYNDARIRNLNNQIEDLQKQIETGERPGPKAKPIPSAEVQALVARRDALIRERDSVDAGARKNESEKEALRRRLEEVKKKLAGEVKPKRAPEQRVDDAEMTRLQDLLETQRAKLAAMRKEDAARKGVQDQIANLLQRLAGKEPDADPVRADDSPQVKELKRIRDELSDQLRVLENPPKDPEVRYQEIRAKAIQKRIDDLQARIAAGEFDRAKPVPRELDEANKRAAFELEKVKEEFERLRFEAEMAKRTPVQKVLGGARDAINLARAYMTSVDLSGLLRQGGFISFGRPVRALRSVPSALKSFVSEKAEFEANEEIKNRPNAPLYKKYGLELTGIGSGPLSKVEEAYATRWLNKVPWILGGGVVRGSGRSYTIMLNRIRADSFDAMLAALAKDGSNPTKEEGEAIANFINVATGRGKVGTSNNAGEALNTVFFAPRLVASRFQLLAAPFTGMRLYGGTNRTRNLITQEYARFLMGVGIAITLASMMKDEDDETPTIVWDPRSADFGKVRFGNTFLDPLAGLAQVTTFLARMATGETASMKENEETGEWEKRVRPLRANYTFTDLQGALGEDVTPHKLTKDGKLPFGSSTTGGTLGRFLRSKLAPVPGAIVNTLESQNMIGEPVTPGETIGSLVTPMSVGNIMDVMEEQGITRGSAITLLGLLGMGVQYRKPKDDQKPEEREEGKNNAEQ